MPLPLPEGRGTLWSPSDRKGRGDAAVALPTASQTAVRQAWICSLSCGTGGRTPTCTPAPFLGSHLAPFRFVVFRHSRYNIVRQLA